MCLIRFSSDMHMENKTDSSKVDPEIREQAQVILQSVRLMKARTIACYMDYVAQQGDSKDQIEITEPQMNMLMVIRDHGPLTVKDLASRLRVSAPSVSAMVERLVELGAVSREPDPSDRRRVTIAITQKARQAIGDIEAHILISIVELLEKVGPEYARTWSEVYERVSEIIIEEFEGAGTVTGGSTRS